MSKFKDPSNFADFYDPSLNLNYYGPDEDYEEDFEIPELTEIEPGVYDYR